MKDNLTIYYDTERDGDIKKMIDKLMKTEDSPYFNRRSRSEIARLILIAALGKKVRKYEEIHEKSV